LKVLDLRRHDLEIDRVDVERRGLGGCPLAGRRDHHAPSGGGKHRGGGGESDELEHR
jgi:hypothetical protein